MGRKRKKKPGKGAAARHLEKMAAQGHYPWKAKPKPKPSAHATTVCCECQLRPLMLFGRELAPQPAAPECHGTLNGIRWPLCELHWALIYKSSSPQPRHVRLRAEWRPDDT
jgi:hypothetical protein